MTIADYRVMVVLRWSDLESLRVGKEPLKNHLHKLRKRHEWPTCVVYEPGDGFPERACEKGAERYLRCTQRKTSVAKGPNDFDREDKIFRWPWSPKGVCVEDAYELSIHADENTQERQDLSNDVPEVTNQREVVPSDFIRQHSLEPRVSRRVSRAAKNNDFIRNKLHELGEVRRKLRATLRGRLTSEERSAKELSLRGLEVGMSKLRTERSDVRPDPEDYSGGLRMPPPLESRCIRHLWCDVCAKCVVCPNDLACLGCYGLNHVLENDPQLFRRHVSKANGPVRAHDFRVQSRYSRFTGGEYYVCRRCHNVIPQDGLCVQEHCEMNGVPVAFPSRVVGARGPRVHWKFPSDYTAELPG